MIPFKFYIGDKCLDIIGYQFLHRRMLYMLSPLCNVTWHGTFKKADYE